MANMRTVGTSVPRISLLSVVCVYITTKCHTSAIALLKDKLALCISGEHGALNSKLIQMAVSRDVRACMRELPILASSRLVSNNDLLVLCTVVTKVHTKVSELLYTQFS